MTSFNQNYLFKRPISKQSHVEYRNFNTWTRRGGVGKNSVLNNLQGSSDAFGEVEEIQKDLGLVSGSHDVSEEYS